MPSNTEYSQAIQNLRVTTRDEELRAGQVAVDPMGLPLQYAGNFAVVFQVHCPQTGNDWAVKCFTKDVEAAATARPRPKTNHPCRHRPPTKRIDDRDPQAAAARGDGVCPRVRGFFAGAGGRDGDVGSLAWPIRPGIRPCTTTYVRGTTRTDRRNHDQRPTRLAADLRKSGTVDRDPEAAAAKGEGRLPPGSRILRGRGGSRVDWSGGDGDVVWTQPTGHGGRFARKPPSADLKTAYVPGSAGKRVRLEVLGA